jgi:hypothetical protein
MSSAAASRSSTSAACRAPCRAERPETDAFETAYPRIPLLRAVAAGRRIGVEDTFQAKSADFRRRGRDLARGMHRDPTSASIPAPPKVPPTLVLRDDADV